jgi:hypothetical protein
MFWIKEKSFVENFSNKLKNKLYTKVWKNQNNYFQKKSEIIFEGKFLTNLRKKLYINILSDQNKELSFWKIITKKVLRERFR